jgi:hypothetical protein
MNNASIPVRHKKISNRQARRNAQIAIEYGMKSGLILLAVLAQHGGDVTVTQGTIDQVTSRLDTLRWEIVPGKVKNEFTVRMIEEHTNGAGINTAAANDEHDRRIGTASGVTASGTDDNGRNVVGAAGTPAAVDQRRSDLDIRRVSDGVAAEGGD